MRKPTRHIFLFLSMLWFVGGFAQSETVAVDTVTQTNSFSEDEERDTVQFSLLGAPVAVKEKNLPKRRVDSLKSDDDFWYANAEFKKKDLPKENEEKPRKSLLNERWFRQLLWIIILCSFIGIVIWYLAASNIFIFRKSTKKIGDDEPAADAGDDIFALNYEKEIAAAEQGGNLRLAVRLHYLETLKQLAEKNLIDYQFGRTNSDYVTQLYKSPHYRSFFRLTRNFDYTWYGQFDLSADVYSLLRQEFVQFKTGLRG